MFFSSLFVAGSNSTLPPQPLGKARKPSSIALIEKLRQQKWICENKTSMAVARVTECVGNLKGYSQKIRIYVSHDFMSESPWSFNLFLHGHRLDQYDTFQASDTSENSWGDYARFFSEAKVNGLLIVPESSGQCTTFQTEIAPQKKFSSFINNLETLIGAKPASYSISGHSGAYRSINSIMKMGHTKKRPEFFNKLESVGLFDAIYSDLPDLRQYFQANKIKLVLYWVTGVKGTTVVQTENFIKKLKDAIDLPPEGNLILKPYTGDGSKPGTYIHMNIVKEGGLSQFLAL